MRSIEMCSIELSKEQVETLRRVSQVIGCCESVFRILSRRTSNYRTAPNIAPNLNILHNNIAHTQETTERELTSPRAGYNSHLNASHHRTVREITEKEVTSPVSPTSPKVPASVASASHNSDSSLSRKWYKTPEIAEKEVTSPASPTSPKVSASGISASYGSDGSLSRKWCKIISRYYTDIENFPSMRNEIYIDLINQAALKLNKSTEFVDQTFGAAFSVEYPMLDLDVLVKKIPGSISTRLIKQADYEKFINLLLRYHVLLISEGLFLSIEPDLIYKLIRSSNKPVAEGFNSPFNYTCPYYCSLFLEDKDFGALPPFNVYIDKVDFPVRWILNPPYTPKCIEMCVDKVISYLDRVPSAEVVMLLPIMYHFEGVNRMRNYKETQSCLLTKGEHTVYSFFTSTSVMIPTKLYLIVNVENSKSKSEQLLGEIVTFLSDKVKG